MNISVLEIFESIVRSTVAPVDRGDPIFHPFELRDISGIFPDKVKSLFDDGHYSHASFEAFKHIEHVLREKSGKNGGFGVALIKSSLGGDDPLVVIDCPADEDYGRFRDNFQQMMIGAFGNIRNRHGHKTIEQQPDECLSELAMAAYFIRIVDPPEGS